MAETRTTCRKFSACLIQSVLSRVRADHIFIGQYDEAIAVYKKLADENPRFSMAHYCLSDAYWRKRMYSQSLEEYKVAAQLSGDRNDSEYASAMEQGFR